jgi:vacuolar protein sorting-associated protein 13A/C
VKVQKGHVGSLRIHVPWQTLTTEPITIELHDVYVLLAEDQHSERQHVAEEIKRTKLAVWDCIARWRSQQSASAAGPQPGSLLSQDRIQVKIHNLHMRYEDESADPGHPFAVGICADHLVVSPLTPHSEPSRSEDSSHLVRETRSPARLKKARGRHAHSSPP